MKCPKHELDMLVIEELNSNSVYYRCEFITGSDHHKEIHTLLIIDYKDVPMKISTGETSD